MSTFLEFFRLGFERFLHAEQFDALLFIVALCALYVLSDGRRVVGIALAFAAGHALTLVLTTLRLVTVSGPFVEALIVLSALIASVLGIWQTEQGRKLYRSSADPARLKYGLAAGFGLAHGFAFAEPLLGRLGPQADLALPLLGYVLGLEAGVAAVLAALLIASLLMVRLVRMDATSWIFVMLGATGGIALLRALGLLTG